MSEARENLDFGAEERAVVGAVRALGPVQADADYRARLREGFVEGTLSAAPASRQTARRTAPSPLWRWRRLAPVAAVAAIVLLLVVPWVRTPGLEIVGVRGTNEIVLNGEVVSCSDLSPIQAALQPGCRIDVPEGATVEVARAGEIVMDLEGVEFTIPAPPRSYLRSEMASTILGEGTVRVATTEAFSGKRYRLELGEAQLVVGTSVFCVMRTAEGLGIHVLDGELVAVMPDGSTRTFGPRSSARIHGGQVHPMDFDSAEGDRLRSLRERAVLI